MNPSRPINYPFYCIDKVAPIDIIRFLNTQGGYGPNRENGYGWHTYFVNPSYFFLEYKSHMFNVIINRGFKI